MSAGSLALLLGAIAAEILATSSLKASRGLTRLVPSVVVVLGYCTAFFLLGKSLRTIPIGTAYAIWSGLGTAAVAGIGVVFFGESLNLAQIAGIALIVAGVVLLQLFTAAPPAA